MIPPVSAVWMLEASHPMRAPSWKMGFTIIMS